MNNFIGPIFFKNISFQSTKDKYRNYRKHGSSIIASIIFILIGKLCWFFFNTESKFITQLSKHHCLLFPHIDNKHPRIGDIIRYPLQFFFLLIFTAKPHNKHYLKRAIKNSFQALDWYRNFVSAFLRKGRKNIPVSKLSKKFFRTKPKSFTALIVLTSIITLLLLVFSITRFFDPTEQFIFLIVVWLLAVTIMDMPGRLPVIFLAVLSYIASFRYLWWRYTNTLVWVDIQSQIFGTMLIIAETYVIIVLFLGYFQSIWPLHRKPTPLPKDMNDWPSVDIMITTYNEDLSIIKPGVYAALGLDWPKEKLNIYLLDDGNRQECSAFAKAAGINYINRKDNLHAKAGNINNALKCTNGELIAMFDCDFIPARSFLQLTVGWFFRDPKLGVLQTPHHFFSEDPFEKNLHTSKNIPNENQLFYAVIQDGNDTWNASFFCGSSGIFKREALIANGGMSTGCVTEDALTSLNIQRLGYNSAYISIPLSAGLATNSLSDHLGQRTRWARGMAQIFRTNNPLLGKGLTIPQRLCYLNAMLHFFSGVPRLIFFLSPVAYLIFDAYIFYAPAIMVILYVTPHLIHSVIANSRIQGRYRHFLWNEIYETVMSYYIAIPTTIALFNPKRGKFAVTPKGKIVKDEYADWHSAKPYIILAIINIVGLFFGAWDLIFRHVNDIGAIFVTSCWTIYNLIILGGVLGTSIEAKQVRQYPRVEVDIPITISRKDGHIFPCTLNDYSENSIGITMTNNRLLKAGDKVTFYLHLDKEEYGFPGIVKRVNNKSVGVSITGLSKEEYIAFIQCTFSRSDTWSIQKNLFKSEHPVQSMKEIFRLSLSGYRLLLNYAPTPIQFFFYAVSYITGRVYSFLPQMPKTRPIVAGG